MARSLTGFLVLGACAMALSASAQTQRSGSSETQKIVQQYQQLAAERSGLMDQVAQLKKQLDASKAELGAVQKERDALKAQAGGAAKLLVQSTSAKLAAEQGIETSKQRMTELVGRYRDTLQNLKEVESDRTAARKDLAGRNADYDMCAQNNFQLYQIADEALTRLDHVGLFTKASASEPFTQISRARIENLVDEYRARAHDLLLKKKTSAP